MAPTLVFANQLAEYAGTLLPVLVEQGTLPSSDTAQLESLLTDCTQLGTQLAWRSSPCRNSSWRYIPASGCSAP